MKKLLLAICFAAFALVATAQDHFITVQSNFFSPDELTIQLGETVQWENLGGFHNVNGTQETYPDNPEGFGNGSASSASWTYQYTFNTPGVYEYQCDPHVGLGMVGKITVTAGEEDYPTYTIGTVTTNDANGEPDSLGVQCQLQGIVYGYNIRGAGNGLQFTIIDDAGDGIGLFSSVSDFGYTVTEGDEIIVRGTIDQFNGLTQIMPDTLWLESQDNALVEPAVVTNLDETTESQLVTLANVELVNPDNWEESGGSFNVDVTDGANTFQLRIDSDSEIFGQPAPAGTFDVTGIGGQFDQNAPFDEGYQLFPRFTSDFDPYNVADSAFPAYPIGTVTTNDASGEPDSLGVQCELQGVVYGGNFRSGGLQFTIIDNAGDGIGVFNNNDDLGYTVTEGDEIKVRGKIGFFNGLTQMEAEEVEVVSTGNTLEEPTVVTTLGEDTESQFVTFDAFFTLVDPAQWTNSGTGFNVDITDGTNTFQMRIDNDVDLYDMAPPMNMFTLRGIGSQFDSEMPFDEGYQILPRSSADIEEETLSVLDPSLAEGVRVFPNPVGDILNLASPRGFDRIRITNAMGQMVFEAKNITPQAMFDVEYLTNGLYQLTIMRDDRAWAISFLKQ